MRVSDILDLYEDTSDFSMEFVLTEDLGNFKKIQANMLKPFKNAGWGKKQKLNAGLGQNSPFTAKEAKTTADAIRDMDSKDIAGLVIQVGSNQVLAIAKDTGSKDRVQFALDADFLKEVNPAAFSKAAEYTGHGIGLSGKGVRTGSEPFVKLHHIMTAIIRGAKTNEQDVQIILIGLDKDRAEKHGERTKARSGKIYTPKELLKVDQKTAQQYASKFKSALSARLDKYKSGKADSAADVKDAVKVFMEKGYLDKINVGGYVYDLRQDRINFSGLKKDNKDSWYGESYIEYQMTNDDWDKVYEKVRAEYKKFTDEGMDKEEAYEKSRDKTKIPPKSFKIMLVLNGASIQPSGEVQVGDSYL